MDSRSSSRHSEVYGHPGRDVAGTAEEALELMAGQAYTAAIIDLALPGIDGLQLISQIRAMCHRTYACVMMTALPLLPGQEAGPDAGFKRPTSPNPSMTPLSSVSLNTC